MEKLALYGGQPARSKPLPPVFRGALVYGGEEEGHAGEIIRAQSPFRYYGPNIQHAVQKLEDMMTETLQVPYALAVSSGTAGLVVAMKAMGIGYGDKVIVPANTFIASAGAVICAGAVPVFVDIDESLNLDPDDLERVFDDEVKAIMAVHINGACCDMEKISAFAAKHRIYVFEDVAQSLGTRYKGQYGGTLGDLGVFSFQIQKILTAGEGGAVTARDPDMFERAVRYHDQGSFRDKARYGLAGDKEANWIVGQNYRMNELAGAVMIEQWHKLDSVVSTMRTHHRKIKKAVAAEIPGIRFRRTADDEGDIGCVLGIVHPDAAQADRFMEAMRAENINFINMYDGNPVYTTPAIFKQQTADPGNYPFNYPYKRPVTYSMEMCPKAPDVLRRVTILHISPLLEAQDSDEIIKGIVKVCKGLHLFET
jgi:8-amino-3,8-dideoxy-alpha-D-manno-octulosonate transaminase